MKNKYFKLSVVTAALLTSIATLSSCGGNRVVFENLRDDVVIEVPTEEVTVEFWHTLGKNKQGVLIDMIEAFEAQYPNITINHSQNGGYGDLRDKILKAIPANETPTMAFAYPDHVADYLDAGAVVPVDQFINSDVEGFGLDTEDFIDAFWKEGTSYDSAGTVLSVPFSKSTEVMFYNKTAFDTNGWTVPTTWDEMWELCAKIKEKDSKITPLGYDSDDNLFITMCEQLGIPYTSIETKFDFVNDEAKAMVAGIKEKYDLGYLSTKGTSENAYTSTQFTEQKLYMTIGSTGGTTYNCPAAVDGKLPFEVGVAPIPQVDVNNAKVISQGPSICFFTSDHITDAQLNAAFLFYKFITNTDNTAYWSIDTGYEPVRKSAFESDHYQAHLTETKKTASAELLQKVANLTNTDTIKSAYYTSPAFKGSATARDEVGGILTQVMLGQKEIDEAFDDALTTCVFSVDE